MSIMTSEVVEVVVRTPEDVAVVQASARTFSALRGLSSRQCWEVAIAVSEMASNIVKYGVWGRIEFRVVEGVCGGVEVIAEDHGAGIADVDTAMQDGVSQGHKVSELETISAATGLGNGLGAIQRMMDVMQIERTSSGGARIIARKYARR